MVLSDPCGAITRLGQPNRETDHGVLGMKAVITVLMTVLTVGVIVKTGQDDGSTGTATGGSAKGVVKPCAILCQSIQIGRLNDGVAVTTGIPSLIVHDEHHDVACGGLGCILILSKDAEAQSC